MRVVGISPTTTWSTPKWF